VVLMGRMALELYFLCENKHQNRDQAAWFGLFVDDGDIKRLKDFHFWVNEKNFSYMFKSFTHCPECGKPYEKFEITKRKNARKKGSTEYSFIHGQDRCTLTINYDVVDWIFDVMVEDLIHPKVLELFSKYKHCPYCGNASKGIKHIKDADSYHLYYKIQHA